MKNIVLKFDRGNIVRRIGVVVCKSGELQHICVVEFGSHFARHEGEKAEPENNSL